MQLTKHSWRIFGSLRIRMRKRKNNCFVMLQGVRKITPSLHLHRFLKFFFCLLKRYWVYTSMRTQYYPAVVLFIPILALDIQSSEDFVNLSRDSGNIFRTPCIRLVYLLLPPFFLWFYLRRLFFFQLHWCFLTYS